jgi:hypothetical protein
MKTVSRDQVVRSEAAGELALPPRVQEALGELVNSAKEGLLALSVGVGLGVLATTRSGQRCATATRAAR